MPPRLTCHDNYRLHSHSAWASMTALHLLPPSVTDPHYSGLPLTYSSDCFCFFNWPDVFLASSVVNKTTMEVVDSREVNISAADATQWQIQGLEEGCLYRFLLSGCTRAGCGPPLAQESVTIAQTREYQLWEIPTRIFTKTINFAVTHTHTGTRKHTHVLSSVTANVKCLHFTASPRGERMKPPNLLCTCLLKGTPKDVKYCKFSIITPTS